MTDLDTDFNYLSKGYSIKEEKPKRSLKKKLVIVFSFVAVLAITPSLIFAISEINLSQNPKLASNPEKMKDTTVNKTPQEFVVTIEEPATSKGSIEVLNNDSYWKISKRACDEGKYYLSISKQNNAKALYAGDTVTVNCIL